MKKALIIIWGLCILSACHTHSLPEPEYPSGCTDFIIERITEQQANIRLIKIWIPGSKGEPASLREVWVLITDAAEPLMLPCNLPATYRIEGLEVRFDANVLISSRTFSDLDGFIPVSINYIKAYVEDDD